MTAVLFEPHLDDAPLFFAYGLLEFRPHVVTVFGNAQAQLPDVSCDERVLEHGRALAVLGGFGWSRWLFPDTSQDTPRLREAITACMVGLLDEYSECWAPLPEVGGHEQHNMVGECAELVFGAGTRFYGTYRRGGTRTRVSPYANQGRVFSEVTPEPGWAALKYAAMACYSSQIELPATRPWFQASDCLREWRT